jgi:hypothetical protein
MTQRMCQHLFSIQSIRFSDEELERLGNSDDNICEKQGCKDIIYHCSWRTSVDKMLKGSIEDYHNRNDADQQDLK